MKAVKTENCNATLRAEGCKNLPARRVEYRSVGGEKSGMEEKPLVIFSSWWELTDEEMHALARAATKGRPRIRLDVFAQSHPPVLLVADGLTPDEIDAMVGADRSGVVAT